MAILTLPAVAGELAARECNFSIFVAGWRGQVECFAMPVLEDHADPNSASLDLGIYRLNARSEDQGPPIIYLAGGPGVGTEYYVDLLLRHPLRETRPIIILEQRGIGASGELCPRVRSHYYRRVASRRSNELRSRQFIGIMHRCFIDARARGRAVDAYTTAQNALDVRELRLAFGLEQVDLWAVSYGTILAQAYMRLEPEAVGTVLFDATVPIDYALETNLASNFRRALAGHWDQCVDQGKCDPGGPTYADRLERLIPEYDARPLRLIGFSPEPFIVVNSVYITGQDAWGIVFVLLYGETAADRIDRVLTLLERRSAAFLRAHYQRLVIPGFSYGMHYAINCRGPLLSEEQLAELREVDPIMYGAMNIGLLTELCAGADLASIDGANDPVEFAGPMLVLAGEWDPITPLSVSDRLIARFPAAQFLEIPGGTHGPSRSLPCAQEIARTYFADPSAPVADICGRDRLP